MTDPTPNEMTLAQLGHHVGLHVDVNLEGKTVGETFFDDEQWVPGRIVAVGALGNSLTIKLDTPVGGGSRGFLGRRSHGEDMISVDDVARVRQVEATSGEDAALREEVASLLAEGKKLDAIARYRASSGATLEEARAFIARLQ
jgi:hypothetical protein